jgi:hypothetical protein
LFSKNRVFFSKKLKARSFDCKEKIYIIAADCLGDSDSRLTLVGVNLPTFIVQEAPRRPSILLQNIILIPVGLVLLEQALGVSDLIVNGPAHLLHERTIVRQYHRSAQIRRQRVVAIAVVHDRLVAATRVGLVQMLILVMMHVKVLCFN